MTSYDGTVCGGRFVNHRQAVADYLAATVAELIRTEYLALRRATLSGQQQVCVTNAGRARYVELDSNGVREARHGDR